MGYVRVLDLVGAFHVEQNMVDAPEQFVMEEIFLGKTNRSYCSSKMSPLLCARAPPVIRAALFTSLLGLLAS